jgi:hypothetical protein
VGGSCSTHERVEKSIQNFGPENLKGRDHSEDLEDNIRMDVREIAWEGVDWMHLAHCKNQWRALVNMVINLRVP